MSLLHLAGFVIRGLALNGLSRADPARVEAVQRRRLAALVRLTVRRSPFYARKYAGIDPARFRLIDLPPVTKPELMANFEDALTVRDLRLDDLGRFMADPDNLPRRFRGRYVLSHTSGSQGQPITVVQDRACLELLFLLQMTRGNRAGRSGVAEAARNLLRRVRLAVIVAHRGFYPSCSTFAHVPAPVRAFVEVRPISMLDPRLVEKLNDYRPMVLSGYSNVLARLASDRDAGRLRLPDLRHVVNHSETLTPQERERLRAAFGVPVLNNYATAECPFLSNGCPTDPGAHVNADCCIVEVVGDDYRPVPAGTQGKKILVTNLINTVQPIIRYEVSDLVTMADTTCGCGSRLPRIADIDGRRVEDFWVRDGAGYRALSPYLFKTALFDTPEVREWQAVQSERNLFRLRVEMVRGAAFDRRRIAEAVEQKLEEYGLRGVVRFEVEAVPALASDESTAKFRQTVSLGAPPGG